jgi:hypothetical protein
MTQVSPTDRPEDADTETPVRDWDAEAEQAAYERGVES